MTTPHLCARACRWMLPVFAAFALAQASAHEDPPGDIHPWVTATEKDFIVEFQNNDPPGWKEPKKYRMVLSANGEVLLPRKEIAPVQEKTLPQPKSGKPFQSAPTMPAGLTVQEGDTTFVFPDGKDVEGAPFYYTVTGGKPRKVPLPIAAKHTYLISDALVTDGAICLLLSFWNPNFRGPAEAGDDSLYLYFFPAQREWRSVIHRVGRPAHIYMFPICSKLLASDGKFAVSWVEPMQGEGFRLILTTWDPAKNVAQDKPLTREIDWNTDLSMARIGKDLLIAWHWQAPRDRHCRIRTFHTTLD